MKRALEVGAASPTQDLGTIDMAATRGDRVHQRQHLWARRCSTDQAGHAQRRVRHPCDAQPRRQRGHNRSPVSATSLRREARPVGSGAEFLAALAASPRWRRNSHSACGRMGRPHSPTPLPGQAVAAALISPQIWTKTARRSRPPTRSAGASGLRPGAERRVLTGFYGYSQNLGQPRLSSARKVLTALRARWGHGVMFAAELVAGTGCLGSTDELTAARS